VRALRCRRRTNPGTQHLTHSRVGTQRLSNNGRCVRRDGRRGGLGPGTDTGTCAGTDASAMSPKRTGAGAGLRVRVGSTWSRRRAEPRIGKEKQRADSKQAVTAAPQVAAAAEKGREAHTHTWALTPSAPTLV